MDAKLAEYMKLLLELFIKCEDLTRILLKLVKEGNSDEIYTQTINRDKLFNLLNHLQQKVENEVALLSAYHLKDDEIQYLKDWHINIDTVFKTINSLDEQIIKLLEQNLNDTQKELLTLYQEKKLVKSYNLSNVR